MGGTVGGHAGERINHLAIVSAFLVVLGVVGGFVFAGESPPTTLTTVLPSTSTSVPKGRPVIDAHGVTIDVNLSYLIGHSWEDRVDIHWVRIDPKCRIGVTEKGVTVATEGDAIAVVTVQTPGIATREGVEVGTPTSIVQEIYGLSSDESGKLVMTDGTDELVIGFSNERVAYLWSRRTGSSVGC